MVEVSDPARPVCREYFEQHLLTIEMIKATMEVVAAVSCTVDILYFYKHTNGL